MRAECVYVDEIQTRIPTYVIYYYVHTNVRYLDDDVLMVSACVHPMTCARIFIR